MKTIYVKPKDVEKKWYVIDAEGKILGHVAVKAASILRGKHKPLFAPHQDLGDFVIVINAEKALLSGNKRQQKAYYHHSGYPSGLRVDSYETLIARKPCAPMEKAIKGMLPNGTLGNKLFTNLKVYAGADHPHQAQKPENMEL